MITTASSSPAVAVACRVCGAHPGNACRDSLGRTMEVHPLRHFAWVRAGRPPMPTTTPHDVTPGPCLDS
jgi:hypothetical protein